MGWIEQQITSIVNRLNAITNNSKPIHELPNASTTTNQYVAVSDGTVTGKKLLPLDFDEKVPLIRTITIDGQTQDLSQDRSWTTNAVKVIPQSFLGPQQDQARDNINALSRTPNGNDQLIQGGLINPVYLSVDILTGVVKFVNDIEPDAEGKVYITIDDIPGLDGIIDDIVNNQIVTQAVLEDAIVEYKNANGNILFDVDWTEMIDDNYIRGNMTAPEKEAFRDKINALSKTPNGTDLLIGTNNKVNDIYLPDTIFGQLRWGGTFNNSGTIDAAANFPELEGSLINSIDQNEYYGVFFIAVMPDDQEYILDGKTFNNGDWAIVSGNGFLKADNSDAVSTVAGKKGAVILEISDIVGLVDALNNRALINGSNIPSGTVWNNLTAGDSRALGGYVYVNDETPDFEYIMVFVGGNWKIIRKSTFVALLAYELPSQTGSTSVILTGGSYQRAALTGDVTAAQNSNSTTISNNAVTNAKAADMPALTIKGNNTGSASDPKDLTVSQAREMLGINNLEYKTEFRTFTGTTGIDVGGINQYVARLISPIGSPSTFSISGANIHGMRLLLRIAPGSACTININYRTPGGSTGTTFTTTDANTTVELIYDKNDDVFDYIGSTGSVPAT
ncbi:hypothetical protein [Paenimyroides ceti]